MTVGPGEELVQPAETIPWRASSGSAAVLGLCELRMDATPTTAYLMLGERCSRNCSFCAQARESRSSAEALSRVTWPAFPPELLAEAVARAYSNGVIQRVCLQATISRDHVASTHRAVRSLAQRSPVPICASVMPRDTEDVAVLLAAGAERVTIALDAASERVYREAKGGSWEHPWGLLERCARLWPGHIGTHLMVGLGETQRELVECFQRLADLGVTVALFAFTPVPGTLLAQRQPPPLQHYRCAQVARWLIIHRLARAEDFGYDDLGRLCGYGLSSQQLRLHLAGGEAFRTAGCPGCNRPYYNERPGGVMHNYPRPLTPGEADLEVQAFLDSLPQSATRSH